MSSVQGLATLEGVDEGVGGQLEGVALFPDNLK